MHQFEVEISPAVYTITIMAEDLRAALAMGAKHKRRRAPKAQVISAQQIGHIGDTPHYAEVVGACEACETLILELHSETGHAYDPLYGTDVEGVDICRECWPDEWDWPQHFGPKPQAKSA